MKISSLLLSLLFGLFSFQYTHAQTPSLGNYSATTIAAAGNGLFVYPATTPVNAGKLVATTSINFKGQLIIQQSTGRIGIANASPAGTYIIRVRSTSVTGLETSFILTVGNPLCNNATFSVTGGAGAIHQQPLDMIVTDMDNDNRVDMVSISSNWNYIDVSFNYEMGRNIPTNSIPTGAAPVAIAAGDFNTNGSQDIITVSRSTSTAYINFTSPVIYYLNFDSLVSYPVSSGSEDVVVADFNNDNKPDFATAGTASLSVRLGNGAGNFTTAPDVPVTNCGHRIAVDDFNNDGNADIAVVNIEPGTLSIKLGNGAGGFSNGVTIATFIGCFNITTTDINNDGYTDMVLGSVQANRVLIFLGTGTGSFTPAPQIPLNYAPFDIATGDFNGDGNIDLAIASATIYLYIRLGNGTGSFTANPDEVLSGIYPQVIEATDMYRDGRQDIVFPNNSDGKMYVRYGTGGDINLQGNSYNLPNGSNNPAAITFTSFGAVNVGNSLTRNYTIQNTGNYSIIVNNIYLTGADSALFSKGSITFPATIDANSSTSFSVTFAPTSLGIKTAWVNVSSNDCDEALYRFGIKGGPDTAAALHFDGVNDYISLNDTLGNVGISDLTFSAWVQAAPNTAMSIMNKGSNCTAGSFMDMALTANGRLVARFGENASNTQSITGKALVGNNVWHHVAFVRKSDTISLYVDGIKDTVNTFSNVSAINNTAQFLLGASNCSSLGSFFNGKMDEVRLYKRALSASEIQTNLSCELVNPQLGLLAYYRFNQGYTSYNNSGVSTLIDSSTKGNNGMLNNFALSGTTSNWIAQGPVISGVSCSGRSTWLGITANWDDPSNWSNGFVPSEFTQVVINAGTTTPLITSLNSICYSLTLNNGAVVRVIAGANLTILR